MPNLIRNMGLTLALLAAGSAIPTQAANAATPDAATIARQGNGHGAAACSSCHGSDGRGQAAAGFPRLAGLNAEYLLRQLDAFANGTRVNAVMQPTASALSEDERRALATYYSKLPVPAASTVPASSAAGIDNALGKRWAIHGLWSKQVPGCVQCHGPHGVGVGAHFPPLAGQSATYLASQLRAFKQGTRHNDPLGLMQHVASALDEKDIQAVSAWFAAQPVTLQGDKR